jgi:hypothetical protein
MIGGSSASTPFGVLPSSVLGFCPLLCAVLLALLLAPSVALHVPVQPSPSPVSTIRIRPRPPYKSVFISRRTSVCKMSLTAETAGHFVGPGDEAMRETYDELAASLVARLADTDANKQLWVGIAGGPGAGKSTLAARVRDRINELRPSEDGVGTLAVVLPMDGFHYRYVCTGYVPGERAI